jgi:hypothetical protein
VSILNPKTICIAGFIIKLCSEYQEGFLLEEGFIPFLINHNSNDFDVSIISVIGIPEDLLMTDNLLFEAKNEQQKFFSIYQQGESYKFIVYNQQLDNNEIQQVAILNQDLNNWIVYSAKSENNELVYPILYPLGPLVMYYLTVKYDAIMIHASGVFDGQHGRIFSGVSGTGKSTISFLWQKNGSLIINDDRLIIRKENDDYFIYNTPMFYADIPKRTQLHSVNLIHHASRNNAIRLNGAMAVSQLMAFCIQHSYNNVFLEHHLEFLSGLCAQLPVYDLGFLPDETIIDFIKTHAH